jgi:hypothetical protein
MKTLTKIKQDLITHQVKHDYLMKLTNRTIEQRFELKMAIKLIKSLQLIIEDFEEVIEMANDIENK